MVSQTPGGSVPLSGGSEPNYRLKFEDKPENLSSTRGRQFSLQPSSDSKLHKQLYAEKINNEDQKIYSAPEVKAGNVEFSVRDLSGKYLRVQTKIEDFARGLGLTSDEVITAAATNKLHVNIEDALKPKSRLDELQMLLPRPQGASRGSGSPGGVVWDVSIEATKIANRAKAGKNVDVEESVNDVLDLIQGDWFENEEEQKEFEDNITEFATIKFNNAIEKGKAERASQ